MSRDLRQHDCFTAERYRATLEAACLDGTEQVLDVGCGDGALTGLIAARLPRGRVLGVEPEAVGRALATELLARRVPDTRIFSSTSEVPDGSQDVIVCSEVIEHVEAPEVLLAELVRILRPAGRVVITTPVRLTEKPSDVEHVYEYFPGEFADLVSRFFRVQRHERFCPVFAVELYYWRPWFFLRRGVCRWVMNLLSAWGGIPVMSKLPSLGRYYMTQLIVAKHG